MQKDLKCINVKCLEDEKKSMEDMDTIVQSFKENIDYVKESKTMTTSDLSRAAKTESFLVVCIDYLQSHVENVVEGRREKEVWKQLICTH